MRELSFTDKKFTKTDTIFVAIEKYFYSLKKNLIQIISYLIIIK